MKLLVDRFAGSLPSRGYETGVLHAIEVAGRQHGYDVGRWLTPDVHGEGTPEPCDVGVVWKGYDAHRHLDGFVAAAQQNRTRVLFVDDGFIPGTYQFDGSGTGVFAGWTPTVDPRDDRTTTRLDGKYLLVLMQDRQDPDIQRLSPWFKDSEDLLLMLLRTSRMPLFIVPAHPAQAAWCRRVVTGREIMSHVADRDDIEQLTENARAVATINHPRATMAIERHKPVLSFGISAYRLDGVVLNLDDRIDNTRAAIESICASETCHLSVGSMDDFTRLVRVNSYRIWELPSRLATLCGEVAA